MRRTVDAQAAKNETIIQAFGGLNQNLAEMQKALAAQGVKNESFSKDTLLALDRLKDQIFTGEGAMRDRADAIFNDTCSHLRSERDALGNKIIDVGRAVDAITAQMSPFQEISSKIDTLGHSLAELKTAAGNGRTPRISINVPKQEPSRKIMGLFNMERH